jgi:hypothetical protein
VTSDRNTHNRFSVSAQFRHLYSFFIYKFGEQPTSLPQPLGMPALSDPRNTFEVTVPPLLDEGDFIDFTFRPACPGPVVSPYFLYTAPLTPCALDDED